MTDRVLDLFNVVSTDSLGEAISVQWIKWNMYRNNWMNEKQEIRNYIFATDTSTTSNSQLPWRNSTTIPKLCQIRDNLHANYMAALFPNDHWLNWEGANDDSQTKEKREAVEQYILSKTRQGGFKNTVSRLVLDYIDYGNAFSTVAYVDERITDPLTKEVSQGYVGPKLIRISPYDVAFDPLASSFEGTPKIIRSMMSIGDLEKMVRNNPERQFMQQAIDEFKNEREQIFHSLAQGDQLKSEGFSADGFSDMRLYYQGMFVEVLDFYGDIYDIESGEFLENYMITVVDQRKIIRKEPNPSWLGKDPIQHVGWRMRPDNLYAMGPLDNLVGMQYRIDHLENMKADIVDLTRYPVFMIQGDVEDFTWQPGEKIFAGDEGKVTLLAPDVNVLQADFEIQNLQERMEELAGAPKSAMGIRTPGEKTAFEVQSLDNSAGRIFQSKTSNFEEVFLEPSLNTMFEAGRRNLDGTDVVRVYDNENKVVDFLSITKEDLSADGRLRPVGARHFAQQAQMVQNLNNFFNSAVGTDPAVRVHFSGKKIAQVMEQLLGLEPFGLVSENVRVFEQAETEQLANVAAENTAVEQLTPSGITEDDIEDDGLLGI